MLRLAVHEQGGKRIELVAEVEADGSDGRLIAEAGTHRVTQVVQPEAERVCPHVATVDERDAAEVTAKGRTHLCAERQQAVAADRQPRRAQRAHLVPSPAADTGGAAQEVLLRKRNVDLIVAHGPDVADLKPTGDDEPIAQRQVVPSVGRKRVVVERARHHPAGLLGVKRHLVAAVRVQQIVRGRLLKIESHRVQRAVLLTGPRIEPGDRDQLVAKSGVGQDCVGNRADVALARHRHGQRGPVDGEMREGRLGARDDGLVGRRERVPLLRLAAQCEMRSEEVRLVEVEPQPAIE